METQALTRSHNERVLRSLSPGDLIQFPRTLKSHWGVYLGDGDVCHVSVNVTDDIRVLGRCCSLLSEGSLLSASGVLNEKARVCIEKFWNVVGNSEARKNNDMDQERRPLSANEIIRRAREREIVGEFDYDVFTNNCEHFATWCRYGEAQSTQAEVLKIGILVAPMAYGFLKSVSGSKQKEEEKDEEER